MRYMGQSYAIEIPCTPETTEDEFQELFWLRHEELYGYHTDEPWEVQSLRVRASMDPENLVVVQQNGREETLVATATVNCTYDGGAMDTPIYRRESLRLGHRLDGPLIVADETSTTVVPPECTIEVTEHGHLRIDLGEPS